MRIITIIKWKYLRWQVKQNQISFKKLLRRMYWIQELEKLPQYKELRNKNSNEKHLGWYSYNKLRKMFRKEFPDKHLNT